MPPFCSVHEDVQLCVFLLAVQKFADCRTTTGIGHVCQFSDPFVQATIGPDYKGVIVHCFHAENSIRVCCEYICIL